MKLNLKELNPGAWFTFPKGSGKVKLRICSPGELIKIRKQTVGDGVEYVDGKRFEYQNTDSDLERELMWDYCIMDWKDINDAEGNPIPCNKEMKILLMGESPEVLRLVSDGLDKLVKHAAASKVALEKNS